MFVLRNVGKLIFGSGSQLEALIELPQGQLYLVRPLSPKGYSELIFKDAAVQIRRTSQDFHYQLVVQRAYEEGEAELLAEEEGEDAEIDELINEKDEKTFLLDEALHFRVESREGTEQVLAWRDLSGDNGDVYEFVCDRSVTSSQAAQFFRVAQECQYERKYRKPHTTASEGDLEQFVFEEEHPIPPASPIHGPSLTRSIESLDAMPRHTANTGVRRDATPVGTPTKTRDSLGTPRAASSPPAALTTYAIEGAELHFYDFNSQSFVLQDDSVQCSVTEVGKWTYWMQIAGKDKEWLGISVTSDINPVFNFEFLSFIFNQFTEDGNAYSWLLRFKDQATLERFQEAVLRCLWEQLNQIKWEKVKEKERDYVTEAFNDLAMEDAADESEEEEFHSDEEEVEDDRARSERYDSDEDEDDVETMPSDGNVNSQLAVGYKHDRSFVVRGSKIGVFKHTPNNNLEFSTNISKVQTPKGKLFSPKKVMLHSEDSNMILQNSLEPNKLYRMDLEYGKVVDEWNVHEDIPVTTFAPGKKFAQMTGEQTFLGISHNALYRIDPRLADAKLVDSELKQYTSKNDFSALATTEEGKIAVASNKGEIRLFDRLGINAKTAIPALGDAIIGLDVSADGRWVLATCQSFLLLIDAMQHSGKNEGKLGFDKSFPADAKPAPRRLALEPRHSAQFFHETGKRISFTPAKFNVGKDTEETSIITATGPFIVEWTLSKVLKGVKEPYRIKRHAEEVKADDFKYGTDQNVIVALPNEVNMIKKKSLKRPTRESIAGDFRLSTPRRSTRPSGRFMLDRDDVVNSPF